MICFDSFAPGDMRSTACAHLFCKDCWRGYVSNAIGEGPACLQLRCPLPDCSAAVSAGIIKELASPEQLAKYETFALRSFVEDNRSLSWCVGANCENAVQCLADRGPDEPLDVMCSCGSTFCFNCKQEAHRPVACETVRKWVTKNSAESENLNWILANTKPCPKCHRPIEKNQGCMHMTCSQCRFEFCWLCSGAWQEHGERTGGFYACNRYEVASKKGALDEESKRRENAKASLERYMHYFERWDAHNRAREKARQDRDKISGDSLEKLSDMSKTPTSQLKFIMDAWNQIIECRRMLKWTYAYGYYAFYPEDTSTSSGNGGGAGTSGSGAQAEAAALQPPSGVSTRRTAAGVAAAIAAIGAIPNNVLRQHAAAATEITTARGAAAAAGASSSSALTATTKELDRQRSFFEFLQGDAERSLEKLHELAENQLKLVVENGADAVSFADFRKKLIGLTDVTHSFFDKLVKQLEKGFDNLQSDFMGRREEEEEEAMVAAAMAASAAGGSGQAAADDPSGAGTSAGPSSQQGRTAAAAQGGAAAAAKRRPKRTRGRGGGGGSAGPGSTGADGSEAGDVQAELDELVRQQGFWSCSKCTYNNMDLDARTCEMCSEPR